MAKILVADDNSNVQKTLALALADLGVEISAVNNGEAAVRKLPEIAPDLILADIFMPVRNGYEVCEYAKKDSRFSHIPVVLLVGAFDPFDEREAQRVGADGILKKPFVPPEPLITMVRTLLDRTLGERLVAVSVSKPAAVAKVKTSPATVAEVRPPVQETQEEPAAEELSPPVVPVEFGEGEHPVAFGQLLETPVQDSASPNTGVLDPVEDEQVLTGSRPATLGDPIFWRSETPEPEIEPEAPEDAPPIPEMRTWKKEEDSLPRREETTLLQPIEPMELVREEQEETSETVVETEALVLDAAAQAPLHVESRRPPDLAANPLEWMTTAPPQEPATSPEPTSPEWNEAVPAETESAVTDTIESAVHPLGMEPVSSEPEVAESQEAAPEPVGPVLVPVVAVHDTPALGEIPAPPTPEPTPAEISASPEHQPAPAAEEVASKVFSQSAIDTARAIPMHDWEDLTARLDLREKVSAAPEHRPENTATLVARPPSIHAPVAPAPAAQVPVAQAPTSPMATVDSLPPLSASGQRLSPDPALVEAVVQRVLDKMRPQVVDIITKEFLRPIVQALVHREIEKQ